MVNVNEFSYKDPETKQALANFIPQTPPANQAPPQPHQFVHVSANIVRDPQTGINKNNEPYTSFTVAENIRQQTSDGQWVDDATKYYDVYAAGRLGENVAKSLQKGDHVVVSGNMREPQSYTTAEGEVRESNPHVYAKNVSHSLKFDSAQIQRNHTKTMTTNEQHLSHAQHVSQTQTVTQMPTVGQNNYSAPSASVQTIGFR